MADDGETADDRPTVDETTADPDEATADPDEATADGDTFGVGIQVGADELGFVVHVPSDIDSGWTDPDVFQRLIERETWRRLDREATLRHVATTTPEGETVTLGTVTLRPDGTVVDHSLRFPGEA